MVHKWVYADQLNQPCFSIHVCVVLIIDMVTLDK